MHLDTRFACEEESPRPSTQTEHDLTDTEAWVGEYRRRRAKTQGKRRTHTGRVPINVNALQLETPGPVKSYSDPEAHGIVISAVSTHTGSFPLVNHTWQTEFADRDLIKHKWHPVWERQVLCEGNRYCERGGATETVSDAWAKKDCPKFWARQRSTPDSLGMTGTVPEGQQAFNA